jgi:hypothetical protein
LNVHTLWSALRSVAATGTDSGANREASIVVTGPALLGCFRRMLEIAPSNVVHLTDTRGWARDRSMHDWAAFNDDLHDWDDFKAGLDQLTREFS